MKLATRKMTMAPRPSTIPGIAEAIDSVGLRSATLKNPIGAINAVNNRRNVAVDFRTTAKMANGKAERKKSTDPWDE
jgi:hypothetical protein